MRISGIARARARILRNTFRPRGRRGTSRGKRAVWTLTLSLLLGFLAYGALRPAFAATAANPERAGALLALVLAALTASLIVFDLQYALAALWLDSDLDLLRRAPIRPAELFAIKLADAAPRTSAMLWILGLPALAAFATVLPLPVWGWALLPVLLAALWAAPLSVGIALSFVFVRWIPLRKASEALALLSTLAITTLWLATSFGLPWLVEHESPRWGSLGAWAASTLQILSPGHATARCLVLAHQGLAAPALVWAGSAALMGSVSLLVAVMVAAAGLDATLARFSPGARRSAPRDRTAGNIAERPSFLAAMIRRDARMFTREWSAFAEVFTGAALWTLLPLVAAPGLGISGLPLARVMLVALSVGLGFELAARAIPLERDGIVWVRLSPVSGRRWIAGRLLACGAIALAFFLLAAVALAATMGLPLGDWARSAAFAMGTLWLALSVGIWVGVVHGDPGWKNTRAMLTLPGRLIAILAMIVQAGGWLSLLSLSVEGDRLRLVSVFLSWSIGLGLGWVALADAGGRLERKVWTG